MSGKLVLKNIVKVLVAISTSIVLFFGFVIGALDISWRNPNGDIYVYLLLIVSILIEIIIIALLWKFIKKKFCYIPICCIFLVCIATYIGVSAYDKYIDNIPIVGETDNLLKLYAPYEIDSKVVTLDEESELMLTTDFPVLDGATALYPIYSAFAKAVYPKEIIDNSQVTKDKVFKCTTTTKAYKNIVTGEADIIFAALPSAEQEQFAEENNVELVYTPIGKEAFVFFVNAKNPLDDITVQDIQKIYSGEITDWREFGISKLGEIRAFQRDKGSGSQSTLEKLMVGRKLMVPPQEDVIDGMGGIIKQTADYKNYKNAIGYSFRFYATEMVKNNQIKLLKVNGVYPNLENIENGTYPLASNFYAVTRSDASENTLKLLRWIQEEQGQIIVEKTGYTPIKNSKKIIN